MGFLIGAALLLLLLLVTTSRWLVARSDRREEERLARLSASDLVSVVRSRIQATDWRTLPAGALLFTQSTWTDVELLDALNQLYVQAMALTPGDGGKDGNVFLFYDCGLKSIQELLAERLGNDSGENSSPLSPGADRASRKRSS